jgi:hypothetical protein
MGSATEKLKLSWVEGNDGMAAQVMKKIEGG